MEFAFELCLAIGCPHPQQLRRLLTDDELNSWWRYWLVSPWGERRADHRAAAAVVRAHVTEVDDLPDIEHPYWRGEEDHAADFAAAAAHREKYHI